MDYREPGENNLSDNKLIRTEINNQTASLPFKLTTFVLEALYHDHKDLTYKYSESQNITRSIGILPQSNLEVINRTNAIVAIKAYYLLIYKSYCTKQILLRETEQMDKIDFLIKILYTKKYIYYSKLPK